MSGRGGRIRVFDTFPQVYVPVAIHIFPQRGVKFITYQTQNQVRKIPVKAQSTP
jgi:hypothetical protein